MDLLDQKLLLEIQTFNGIFAKSADENERLVRLEKDAHPATWKVVRTALASFKSGKMNTTFDVLVDPTNSSLEPCGVLIGI
jgi:hypothetical protein